MIWRSNFLMMHRREDAVRLGLFVGGFTGTYHLISGALKQWQGILSPAHNCMAAGTAAGQSAVFHSCTTSIHTLLSLMYTFMSSCTASILAEPLSMHWLLVASSLCISASHSLHIMELRCFSDATLLSQLRTWYWLLPCLALA